MQVVSAKIACANQIVSSTLHKVSFLSQNAYPHISHWNMPARRICLRCTQHLSQVHVPRVGQEYGYSREYPGSLTLGIDFRKSCFVFVSPNPNFGDCNKIEVWLFWSKVLDIFLLVKISCCGTSQVLYCSEKVESKVIVHWTLYMKEQNLISQK